MYSLLLPSRDRVCVHRIQGRKQRSEAVCVLWQLGPLVSQEGITVCMRVGMGLDQRACAMSYCEVWKGGLSL